MIEKPIGEAIVEVAKQFIGSPYEAGTLDRPDSEQLVVDLHSFDCVTLVENVLALARCVKNDQLSYDAYCRELENIRYRGGKLRGYGSRLHYYTDWIYDNEKKGILRDVTKELGGVPYRKKIDFMSTHRKSYPKLVSDSLYRAIQGKESEISERHLWYIPKTQNPSAFRHGDGGQVGGLKSQIRSGDLVAITSSVEGLDISHTGIAVKLSDGTIHLLHAPDVGDSVRITSEPLERYLARHSLQTGIMVARPQ